MICNKSVKDPTENFHRKPWKKTNETEETSSLVGPEMETVNCSALKDK